MAGDILDNEILDPLVYGKTKQIICKCSDEDFEAPRVED